MPAMNRSMGSKFKKIMRLAVDLAYNDNGGNSQFSLDLSKNAPEKSNHLWNIVDGLPVYIHKWLNSEGSLTWILENTPEVVEKKLDDELAFLEELRK